MSVLGTKVLRKEDPRLLVGEGRYVADLNQTDDPRITGVVHVAFVRSTVAHAEIASIDIDDAVAAPGVVGVFTHTDLDLIAAPAMGGALGEEVVRPFLAHTRVRFVGEAVVAVVAETAAAAVDAAESVFVDYEILEPVVDLDSALAGDVLLFPAHGSNVVQGFGEPAPDDLFDGCAVVVEAELLNQRPRHAPSRRGPASRCGRTMRSPSGRPRRPPTACDAAWWSSSASRRNGSGSIAPSVGGGFGAKMNLYRDEAVVVWIARRVGRPARWIEERTESMVAMHHGRGQRQRIRIGGSRDGDVTAYALDVTQDAGAYPEVGAFLPYFTRMMAQGTYVIEQVACETRSVLTNTTPTAAYRGAGRPEACAAIERSMDLFAAEIGMDPARAAPPEPRARRRLPVHDPNVRDL